jgi:hypothetical protein
MTVVSMLLLPDETYEEGARNAEEMLAVLRLYDDFLARHRIRPEFFCKYREKIALQRSLRTLHSLQGTVTRKRRRYAAGAASEHRFTGKYSHTLSAFFSLGDLPAALRASAVDPPEREHSGSLHVSNCMFRQGLLF